MKQLLGTFATLALLGACGPMAKDTNAARFFALAKAKLTPGEVVAAPEAEPMTREQIDASGKPLMLVTAPDIGGIALVSPVATNGDVVTWLSPDGISITVKSGIVIATRGFGDDLSAANVDETLTALRNGGGTATRVAEYYTGQDRIARPTLTCDIKATGAEKLTIVRKDYQTTRFEEHCVNAQLDYISVFWIDEAGKMVQSQQWLSNGVGYLTIQTL